MVMQAFLNYLFCKFCSFCQRMLACYRLPYSHQPAGTPAATCAPLSISSDKVAFDVPGECMRPARARRRTVSGRSARRETVPVFSLEGRALSRPLAKQRTTRRSSLQKKPHRLAADNQIAHALFIEATDHFVHWAPPCPAS